MKTKIITFWAPVKRQGGCSTNAALYASQLSHRMNETEKAVIFSLNKNVDVTDYLTHDYIKNGSNDLLFLSEMNNIKTKEDVLAYTHKTSENLDILGTGKNEETICKQSVKLIEVLSEAYDYIVIDSVTEENPISFNIFSMSDVIVVCIPQDRFVYESLDMSIFENKKVIFLSSMHNEKSELTLNKIKSILPVQVYYVSQNDKINQAVYEQEIFSYINSEIKKKSSVINELRELHNEINRLINIENLNITYEIKKNFDTRKNKVSSDYISKPEIKVIKEYKFIKAKNNIAVINLSKGAGSTFISLNLAYVLKDSKVDVSVVEVPHKNMKADIFNIISGDYETSNRENPIIKDNIKYYINNNNSVANYSKEDIKEDIIEYISLISRDSNINIYDIGSQEMNEDLSFLLNVIDIAIIIVDPMPYLLLQAEVKRIKSIKMLEEKNINVIYVINKYIKDLSKRDIEKYLQVKVSACIPFICPETLYAAYYSNHAVYRLEKSEIFRNELQKVLSSANILQYEDKKDKKFNFFNWR